MFAPSWSKTPAGMAAAGAVVAAIAVGGYFGVTAMLSHSSRPAPPRVLAEVAGLPRGAAECQRIYTDGRLSFNAGARGTPTTTCEFVEQVRRAYGQQIAASTGTVQIRVASPATEKWYDLTCITTGNYVTCAGGAGAVIYLYNR